MENNKQLKPLSNSGVIERPPYPKDWIAGQETGIELVDIIKKDNWSNYLPSNERQIFKYFDSFACVTFSALNCVETQINFMVKHNLIPDEKLQKLKEWGYFDENGNFNVSDRFTAKMSGTTKLGNYMTNIWESIRKDGLVPEKMWPAGSEFVWDKYYEEIPQEIKDFGKNFLEIFQVNYEFVVVYDSDYAERIKKHLQQAPLHIAAPVCPPWNTDKVLEACGDRKASHATMIYGYTDSDYFNDFDHYNPFQKKLDWEYYIPFAIKGVVTISKDKEDVELKNPGKFTKDLCIGMRSPDVKRLQDALKSLNIFPKEVISTGYYGRITQVAVREFQSKYQVAGLEELSSVYGRRVGLKTRSKLNEIFKNL